MWLLNYCLKVLFFSNLNIGIILFIKDNKFITKLSKGNLYNVIRTGEIYAEWELMGINNVPLILM